MITSLKFISHINKEKEIPFSINSSKVILNLGSCFKEKLNSFDIEINFNQEIELFRTHDYKWIKCNKELIASAYTPKIIKLKNAFFVQPNIQEGIWEYNPKFKSKILWRFNPENSEMLTKYSGKKNEKIRQSVLSVFDFQQEIELLFSDKNAVEFSRSPIPFSAIACFTDHCDFDTLENLKLQREFFKEKEIKVTKGFFLNHFTKREDNASFEKNSTELLKWKNDGHELCYHSLSQSIKNEKESFEDFTSFESPFENIPTWIDHGYQPYNFSLYQNLNFENKKFEEVLNKNKIKNLWNYVDSGKSTLGVINQLNKNDFTLECCFNGINTLKFKDRVVLKIKIILFHYYTDEKLIEKYKKIKRIVKQKSVNKLFSLVKNCISISIPLLKIFFTWNSVKNNSFKLSKYSSIVFNHKILNTTFKIFQTIEMLDFKKSLNSKNIDKLISEKGVFIAHTYFSVPMKNHFGKLFNTETTIDQEVAINFAYLSLKIKNNQVWNPTLNELVQFLSKFEKIKLDVNESGNIIIINNSDVPFRELY